MAKRDNGKKFWNFVGNLQGDKVVWMIVLLLILLSIVAIFSSTPLLAIQQHTTRTAIMKEQLLISLAGLFFIILCYNIRSQRFFRAVSKLGVLHFESVGADGMYKIFAHSVKIDRKTPPP